MLIILTDTSEEEDVRINDWLVQENLARKGKVVRTNRNFPFIEYYERYLANANARTVENENAITISDARKCNDKAKRDNLLMPLHVSSNIMNEHFLKNVKALNKTPEKKSDINNSEQKNPRKPNRLATLVNLVKARRDKLSNTSISKSNVNSDMKVNLKTKVEVELWDNDEHCKHEQITKKHNVNLEENSNNETNHNEKNFGTFRSRYDRHGDMTPFDCSMIRRTDSPNVSSSHISNSNLNKASTNVNREKGILTSPQRIQRHHEVHNRINELTKSCILGVAGKEKEYFLATNNVNHDNEDVSQSVARLRHSLLIQDDNSREVAVPMEIYEKLRMHACVTRTSSCEALSSSSIDTNITEFQANRSNKTRENKIKQQMENGDHDSAKLPQFSHYSSLKDVPKRSMDISEQTPNQIFTNNYQMLLNRILDRKQYLNSSYENSSKNRSSNESEPLSYYSRSSADETINSSDDDQWETLSRKNVISRFNKLKTPAMKISSRKADSGKSSVEIKDFTLDKYNDELHCEAIYPKVRQMSSANYSRASKVLRHAWKMQHELDGQLDSDDFSNPEDSNSELILNQTDDALVVSNTADNKTKTLITPVVPMYNDCDTDSDSTWDVCSGL